MLRKFGFGFLVASLVLTFGISSAFAIPMVMNEYNGLFFRNSEVIVDANNNSQADVGEIFWGVYNLNEIVAPTDVAGQTGPEIWPLIGVPPSEITGYFVYEVTAVYDPGEPGNPTPGTPYMEFGPASSDPNSIFTAADLAAGAVLRFFEDTDITYDDSTQGKALDGATDGSVLWTLGFGPNSDNTSTSGYWYALAPKDIPPVGSPGRIGESYGGLNYLNPMLCGLVNDPNETITNLDVEFWFNSEIYRLPVNEDLEIGPDVPMHFGSNDPAVYRPLEEELPGECRMTGGGVTEDGLILLPELTNQGIPIEGTVAEATNAEDPDLDRYQFGGQAGAPTASQPQPFGEWTHHQQKGPSGKFTFHGGTASAPEGTEIDVVTCSDPGFCNPARPAPFKQIDFEGVGTFKNVQSGPLKGLVVPDNNKVKRTFHYFRVHVEDIGEAGPGGAQPKSPDCTHIIGTEIVVPDDCENCPDVYQIEIHESTDPSSLVIYSVGGFIDNGNLQIHPAIK